MKNKTRIVEKAEAEKTIAAIKEEKAIEERRRKVIERINSLMESAGLVRVSKDGKRRFYQAAFEKAFGINKSTASFYYRLERDVPIETLLQIYKHEKINCSLDYLLLRSDAVNYEFDDVIKKTGLSEKAIEVLINKNTPHYVDGYTLEDPFINTLNYLIINGRSFIDVIADYGMRLALAKNEKNKIIEQFNFDEELISAASAYNFLGPSMLSDPSEKILFKNEIKKQIKGRQLTDEEIDALYRYCQRVNIQAVKFGCNEQLVKLLSAIESSLT